MTEWFGKISAVMEMYRQRRPLFFNTPFESGIRSLVILTACYPSRVGLNKLVVLDHFIVHSGDLNGPPSLHPPEASRAAEMLVRRNLIEIGLSLMGTRGLVKRHLTKEGFRFEAGDEAGSFVDLLRSEYAIELKVRANWLNSAIVPKSEEEIRELVKSRTDYWDTEFLTQPGSEN